MDPLNGDAAALYLHKPDDYKKRVKGEKRSWLIAAHSRSASVEYVQRFATADMADGLSATLNGQSSNNNCSSTNQTNGSNNSNETNKNESDDEILSDFSEDEAADMDLE